MYNPRLHALPTAEAPRGWLDLCAACGWEFEGTEEEGRPRAPHHGGAVLEGEAWEDLVVASSFICPSIIHPSSCQRGQPWV